MKFVKQLSYSLALSSVALLANGCAEIPTESGTSLAQPVTIMTSAAPTTGTVRFAAKGGTVDETMSLDFTVKTLSLLAHSEGDSLRIDDLELQLGDITISPEALPPSGLQLTNVSVGLEKVVDAATVGSNPGALDAMVALPVVMRADLVLGEGKTYPLGPVAVTPLQTTVGVRRNGAAMNLTLAGTCAGACWDVPGVASFRDGKVEVALPATVTNN